MRKIIISAVVATVAALSFAAPSQAGWGHRHQGGWHKGYVKVYHYGHRHCFWKKVHRYNKWGHLVIKRVRVCHR